MKRSIRIIYCLVLLLMTAPSVSAKVYAVCVGVNHYKFPGLATLYAAEADARNMAKFLKTTSGGGQIYLLEGKDATKKNILNTLTSIARQAQSGDVITFYYSGHGKSGGMVAYDTSDMNGLVTYRDISNIYKNSKSRTKLIFADTCHSGSGRLTSTSSDASAQLANQNILLFLSSRADENSLEMPGRGGGLFTTYLLKGLQGSADANRDCKVTAKELFNYVSNQVGKDSRNKQHPVMWGKFDPNMILISW